MVRASKAPSPAGASRASKRSPGLTALPGRLSGAMVMTGGSPLPSQASGRAINSPSLSVPVTSITITGGSEPGSATRRPRSRLRVPSSSISRRAFFSFIF